MPFYLLLQQNVDTDPHPLADPIGGGAATRRVEDETFDPRSATHSASSGEPVYLSRQAEMDTEICTLAGLIAVATSPYAIGNSTNAEGRREPPRPTKLCTRISARRPRRDTRSRSEADCFRLR